MISGGLKGRRVRGAATATHLLKRRGGSRPRWTHRGVEPRHLRPCRRRDTGHGRAHRSCRDEDQEGKQPLHALDADTAAAAGAFLHPSKEWLSAVILMAVYTCVSTICRRRCSSSALNGGLDLKAQRVAESCSGDKRAHPGGGGASDKRQGRFRSVPLTTSEVLRGVEGSAGKGSQTGKRIVEHSKKNSHSQTFSTGLAQAD